MAKYFLDTEFIEYPCTIDLISIGIYCEDGREFYNIRKGFYEGMADKWVKENVINKLEKDKPRFDIDEITFNVLDFIGDDKNPEFWAYYADYDWVVFCWLFGTMMDLPKNFPMYCRDLKQEMDRLNFPKKLMPKQSSNEHNALEDAKWNYQLYLALSKFIPTIPTGGPI